MTIRSSKRFFKTLKYSTKYPGRFEDIHQARDWFAAFVHWYNMQHLHSALGYVTPAQRRAGEDKILFKKRNQTIEKARERYPQRWGSRKTACLESQSDGNFEPR
jgi:putative transposase